MDWQAYHYFLAVARSGSLKAAARLMKVNPTTVGRAISALETQLATKLFIRRTDGFVLNASGQRIVEALVRAETEILGAQRSLLGRDERVDGVVKVALPGALANHWLIPRAGPLLENFPDLRLELLTGPSLVNLARRDADLAIRLVEPRQQGLIYRRAGHLILQIYGHRALFKRNIPKSVEDLSDFPFVGLYIDSMSRPELTMVTRIQGALPRARLKSAAWSSVFSAVQAGLGYGILPSFMGESRSDLVHVIPELDTRAPLFLVYHSDLKQAARLRVVIDYLSGLNL